MGEGLISTSFTSTGDAKDADTVSRHFLAGASSRAAQAGNRSLNVGHYFVRNVKSRLRLVTLYLSKAGVNRDDATDVEFDIFAGTQSNDPSCLMAAFVSHDNMTGSTLRVVTFAFAKTLPKKWPRGEAFDLASINNDVSTMMKEKLGLKGRTKFVLIVEPKSFPIFPGSEVVLKGEIDENVMAHFGGLGPYGSPWISLKADLDTDGVSKFNLDVQQSIIAHKVDMGTFMPKGTFAWSESPWGAVVGAPAEDTDSPFNDSLVELCQELRGCVARNRPSVVVREHPASVSTFANEVAANEQDTSSSADAKRVQSLLRLFAAGWTKEGGIRLFDLNEQMTRTMSKQKATRSSAFLNILEASSDKLAGSLDAVNRTADFPMTYRSALAVPSLLLNCCMDDEIISDLEGYARARNTSFSTAHFIPHGHEVLKQAKGRNASSASDRVLQDMMGESSLKTTKVDTTTICEGKIRGPDVVVGTCANITAVLLALVDFDPTSVDPKEVPFLHYVSRTIALIHTSREVRAYRKKRPCNALSNYYVFNVINRMMVTTSKVFRDEESIAAACPTATSTDQRTVSSSPFDIALKAFSKSIDHIRGFAGEAETCDVTDVWKSSEFNMDHVAPPRTKRGRDRDDAEDESPSKKARGGDPRCVIVFGNKMLKMPKDEDYPAGEKPLCAPNLRNGSKGCKNRNCKCNHAGPKKWSKALMEFMKEWMAADNHGTMKWNPVVMTPEILNLTYSNNKSKGAKVTRQDD